MADYGLDPQAALDQPRFCLQGRWTRLSWGFKGWKVCQGCWFSISWAVIFKGWLREMFQKIVFFWSHSLFDADEPANEISSPPATSQRPKQPANQPANEPASKSYRCGQCSWCRECGICQTVAGRRFASRNAGVKKGTRLGQIFKSKDRKHQRFVVILENPLKAGEFLIEINRP